MALEIYQLTVSGADDDRSVKVNIVPENQAWGVIDCGNENTLYGLTFVNEGGQGKFYRSVLAVIVNNVIEINTEEATTDANLVSLIGSGNKQVTVEYMHENGQSMMLVAQATPDARSQAAEQN